jgi:hypothetical protein
MSYRKFLLGLIGFWGAFGLCGKAQGEIPTSVLAAVKYVEGRESAFLPDVQLMVHWLSRKYALPLSETWRGQVLEMTRQTQWEHHELRFYFRVVDPNHEISEAELDQATGFNWITARALYCDRFPLPESFRDSLVAYNQGSYDRTHAAFAYYWAKEKSCLNPADFSGLGEELSKGLVELIEERGADTDVGIEAMAMLLQLVERDKVRVEWVEETLLGAQRPDGSWSEKPNVDQSNDHTTALAIWVLLEWYLPEQPELPWVIPSNQK